jgi:hypothetical protein
MKGFGSSNQAVPTIFEVDFSRFLSWKIPHFVGCYFVLGFQQPSTCIVNEVCKNLLWFMSSNDLHKTKVNDTSKFHVHTKVWALYHETVGSLYLHTQELLVVLPSPDHPLPWSYAAQSSSHEFWWFCTQGLSLEFSCHFPIHSIDDCFNKYHFNTGFRWLIS